MKLSKIISGGQTGVDRGALDACLEQDFPCGGWCPAGRKAEDGEIPSKYPLQEIWSVSYDDRTRKNVNESDATLIIFENELCGGTLLTHDYAKISGQPIFLFKVSPFFIDDPLEQLIHFLEINHVLVLNIAGPRLSQWPEGYDAASLICTQLIKRIRQELI